MWGARETVGHRGEWSWKCLQQVYRERDCLNFGWMDTNNSRGWNFSQEGYLFRMIVFLNKCQMFKNKSGDFVSVFSLFFGRGIQIP